MQREIEKGSPIQALGKEMQLVPIILGCSRFRKMQVEERVARVERSRCLSTK